MVDETTHFTGSYCGDKVPHKLMFMDSVMMIFTTDSTSTEKGFEIHYTTEGKYIKVHFTYAFLKN